MTDAADPRDDEASSPDSAPHADGEATVADEPAAAPSRGKRLLGRVVHYGRFVLIIAVAVFAVWYFSTTWDSVLPALRKMSVLGVVLSGLALLVGLGMNTAAWITLLGGLGHRVPVARSAQIMLVGQLGKYIPGSAWAYLLQMEMGRQYGVARARVLVASLYAAGVGVVASLILGAIALPQISQGHPQLLWLFALLPVGLACLHPWVMTFLANLVLRIFRRPALEHRVRIGTTVGALLWSIGSYAVYGLHVWLLTDGTVPFTNILIFAAALGIGFTASLFAFLLPSGVGVREAALIGILGLVISTAEASAVALVSRAMFTAGDLVTAGAATLIAVALRRRLHREDAAEAEYDDVAAS